MRKPLMAGNWKMHKTQEQTRTLVRALCSKLGDYDQTEIVICPPYTSLIAAAGELAGSSIRLGGQNMHWEKEGAFTGEISAEMLLECGCDYVIIGHSERRQFFGELDRYVKKRLSRALEADLIPIVCVGETSNDRLHGRVEDVILGELEQAVDGLTGKDLSRMIVAYEPVWAIGTGQTATPEIAQEVHQMIREWLSEIFSDELAQTIRILYGGSVTPGNIKDLMQQEDIDGALVGGASLDADSFAGIVRYI